MPKFLMPNRIVPLPLVRIGPNPSGSVVVVVVIIEKSQKGACSL